MKGLATSIAIVALCMAFASQSPLASCIQQTSATVYNNYGYQTCAYTTPGTDILTKFWIAGLGASDNSGTMTTNWMINQYGQTSGNVFPYFTWGDTTSGVATYVSPQPAPWDTSALVPCSRTVFLYSIANGGSPQYLLMSVNGNSSANYFFDGITNGSGSSGHGQNICAPVALPTLTITNSTTNPDG